MSILQGTRRLPLGSSLASLNPYRLATAPLRVLPQFLIIGTQRGGTTSLYNGLVQHPKIYGSSIKEVHYFDLNFGKGPLWYRSHFPLARRRVRGTKEIAGEASPYYLLHPRVPARVQELLPDVKLIVMLRNPVDRAISHYHHMVRLGWEQLSLEEAIAREPLRLAGEADRIRADPHYHSANYRHYSYLTRGLYYEQLINWSSHCARERFLILSSEAFFRSPRGVLNSVFVFLGLDEFSGVCRRHDNAGHYSGTPQGIRRKLHEYFERPNSALFEYLGVDYGWDP
jgi:hypothetical protein